MGIGLAANKGQRGGSDKAAAFAQMAERYRRKGDAERAVDLCRDGLLQFPDHLSGRVTLGWALLDLGRYDEARTELEQVLKRAPDNLTAIRGLAELHDRAESSMPVDMGAPHEWPAADEVDALSAAPAESDDDDSDAPVLEMPGSATESDPELDALIGNVVSTDVADVEAAAAALDISSDAADPADAIDAEALTSASLSPPELVSAAEAALEQMVEAVEVTGADETDDDDVDEPVALTRHADQDLAAHAALLDETGLDPDLNDALAGLEAGLEDGVAEAQARDERLAADAADAAETAADAAAIADESPGKADAAADDDANAAAEQGLGEDARADLADAAMAAALALPMVDAQDGAPSAFESALEGAETAGDDTGIELQDTESETDAVLPATLENPVALVDAGIDHAEPDVEAASDDLAAVDLTDAAAEDLLDAVAMFEDAHEQAAEPHALDLDADTALEAPDTTQDAVPDTDRESDLRAALEAADEADATELALAQLESADQADDMEADLAAFGVVDEMPDPATDVTEVAPLVASAEPDFAASDSTPLADHDSPLVSGRADAAVTEALAAGAANARVAPEDADDEGAGSDDDAGGFGSAYDLEAVRGGDDDDVFGQVHADRRAADADTRDADDADDDDDGGSDLTDFDSSSDAVAAALAAAQAAGGNQGLADQLTAYSRIQESEPAAVDHRELGVSSELAAMLSGGGSKDWTPPTVDAGIPPSVADAEPDDVLPVQAAGAGATPLSRLEQMLRRIQARRLRLATDSVA